MLHQYSYSNISVAKQGCREKMLKILFQEQNVDMQAISWKINPIKYEYQKVGEKSKIR